MGRSVEEIRNDITNGEHLWGSSLVLPGSRRYWLTVPPPCCTRKLRVGKPPGKRDLDLFPGGYLERPAFLLSGSGSRCKKQYGVGLTQIGSMGISAMMHGYMAFDEAGELLVPFRTWRNTITGEAAKKLTELFDYNIPQRWSIAHLYQAVLNKEEHLSKLDFFTTLAGYIHWKLTGKKVLGVGDASGMFPIDPADGQYEKEMVRKFEALMEPEGYSWKLSGILPQVLTAGEDAGSLTEEGAAL